MKKALSKHIYNCSNEHATSTFKLPCKCDDTNLTSVLAIDEHNTKVHSNGLLFACKFCFTEFKQATVLFGHLMLNHDFFWNPYEELPAIIDNPAVDEIVQTPGHRPERKKSIANSLSDSIWVMYGAKDHFQFQKSREPAPKRAYRKRQSKDQPPDVEIAPVSDIRIERVMNETNNEEVSKLTISSSSILTCEYCGGRYLSVGILNAHMANYHSVVPKIDKDSEDRRKKYIKRLNKLINPLSLNNQVR